MECKDLEKISTNADEYRQEKNILSSNTIEALHLQNPAQISPNLYLSSVNPAQDLILLKQLQVNCVLNVTGYEHNSNKLRFEIDYPPEITAKHIIMADEMNVKISDHFDEALGFIHENIGKNTLNKILIHCEAGISRSPTIVIAYLMRYQNQSLKNAYDIVKQRKNNVGPHAGFFEELIQFEQQIKRNNGPRGNDSFKPSISLHAYLVQQMSEGAAAEFTREQISTALEQTNNQPNLALNLLFSTM
jgi:protein-tyrosine phosphatase